MNKTVDTMLKDILESLHNSYGGGDEDNIFVKRNTVDLDNQVSAKFNSKQ